MAESREYTRKPETVRAVQWHKPGDHPDEYEYCGTTCVDVSLGIPSELEPGCWIVDGERHGREVFEDALFRDAFAPATEHVHNSPEDPVHNPAAPLQEATEGDGGDVRIAIKAMGGMANWLDDDAQVALSCEDREVPR